MLANRVEVVLIHIVVHVLVAHVAAVATVVVIVVSTASLRIPRRLE